MPQEPKPKSKILWIVLIIVVVLAVAGAAGWYLMGRGKKTETKKDTTKTTTTEKTTLKTYTNEKYGFSLKYPSDFKYKEDTPEGMANRLAGVTFTNSTKYPNAIISIIVDKNQYVDIKAWGESYTNDENGGQWTTSDATMGEIKGKQLNNDVSDYKTAVIKGENLFEIDLMPSEVKDPASLVKIYKDMISSFSFTTDTPSSSASDKETPAPAATTDLTYENTDYGFTMTFPAEWQGYKFREKKLDGATMTYYVEVPTKDANFADTSVTDSAGYYSPFAISVYTVAEWDAAQAFDGPKEAEVGRGAGYVFGWSQANGIPASDFTDAMRNQIQGIIDSFEVK